MRQTVPILLAAVAVVLTSGCAGPEKKLGRGLNNLTEFTRLGDMRRSIEQTALWEGPATAYTTGLVRGFNRSMARTAIGAYEVLSFPFPSYDPILAPKATLYPDPSIMTRSYPYGGLDLPVDPVYPASYEPGLFSDSTFATDTSLGFSSGDVVPIVPGSRFRIYDH